MNKGVLIVVVGVLIVAAFIYLATTEDKRLKAFTYNFEV